MQRNYFEEVPYEKTNYLFSVGRENYAMPHIHPEFELGIVLEGTVALTEGNTAHRIRKGQMWLMNPYQCHELQPEGCAYYVFLILQVSPSFFRPFLSEIDRMRFDGVRLRREELGENAYGSIVSLFRQTAVAYFMQEPYYELVCAGGVNRLFYSLLTSAPHTRRSDEQMRAYDMRVVRMQRINTYIETHYTEKLMLSDLAQEEGLTLNYLSHFFKDNFGMSFQAHLTRLRCRKAAELLVQTKRSATDICIECGFSALKYMNAGFQEVFAMTPKAYRNAFREEDTEQIRPVRSRTDAPKPRGNRAVFTPHLSAQQSLAYLNRMQTE